PARQPNPPRQQRQTVEDPERGIRWRRGHLGEHRRPARIDRDEVGKRSADIYADAVHGPHPNPPALAGEGIASQRRLPPPQAGEGGGGGIALAVVRADRRSCAARRRGWPERHWSGSEECATLAR